MKIDAAVLGASGYGGGELLRWLSQHPNVASIRGTSRSFAGQAFAEAHPNLRGIVGGSFEAKVDWSIFSGSPQLVVFSALPHGELAKTLHDLEQEWSAARIGDHLLFIDLSGDFRIHDAAAFEKANGVPHSAPEFLNEFVYGLPEWNRAALSGARRIASPGCFATALQLGLLPLRGMDVGFIAASGVTGSSGSGAVAAAGTHHPTRANDFRAYKILTHQHNAEVALAMAACEISGHVSFVAHSAPFVRGIFATLQFQLPDSLDGSALRQRAIEAFRGLPFIRVVESSPRVAAVAGSNFADISIASDQRSGAMMVALDNLGKGMAGQAVQSMNIALGLPETAGLWHAGRYPG
ncbi:MAG TPA: N-acetyl-gamma-glutamyl-phosphate reductase [Chthoniobacterales bacterium]|nr:N-acetyl-gamma-glutamyl-phosphate reductase [Chthoniobacterales bacterium]